MVLELHDLLTAVAKRGHEGLQVLDGDGDVAAAVAKVFQAGQLAQHLSEFRHCPPARWRRC